MAFLAAGQALGIELTVGQGALLAAGTNLATAVPSGPGYLGTFEYAGQTIALAFGLGAAEGPGPGPADPLPDAGRQRRWAAPWPWSGSAGGGRHGRRGGRAVAGRSSGTAPAADAGGAAGYVGSHDQGRAPHRRQPLARRRRAPAGRPGLRTRGARAARRRPLLPAGRPPGRSPRCAISIPSRSRTGSPRAAGAGLPRLDRQARLPLDSSYAWGRISVSDRLGVGNGFISFGGQVRAALAGDGTAYVSFTSPAPILRVSGHSQGVDPLAAEAGAFFARIKIPIDFVPGTETLIAEASPLALYSAFVQTIRERMKARPRSARVQRGLADWSSHEAPAPGVLGPRPSGPPLPSCASGWPRLSPSARSTAR